MIVALLLSVLPEEIRTEVEKIYNHYRGLFYGIALDKCRDDHSAEDVVQESMKRIMTHPEVVVSLTEAEKKSYCATVVHNTAIDHYRKEKTQESLNAQAEEQETRSDLEQLEHRIDAQRELESVLSDLTQEERELILMHYGYGHTYKEIGRLFGITEDAAQKRGKRILKKVQESWNDEDDTSNH